MTPRLLFAGHNVSYGRLLELRHRGEAIVAICRRDFTNTLYLQCITSEKDYITIAGQTKHGFYHGLRWYGSMTGSEDPADYGLLP